MQTAKNPTGTITLDRGDIATSVAAAIEGKSAVVPYDLDELLASNGFSIRDVYSGDSGFLPSRYINGIAYYSDKGNVTIDYHFKRPEKPAHTYLSHIVITPQRAGDIAEKLRQFYTTEIPTKSQVA